MKKVDKQSRTARVGVAAVQLIFQELGFIFREQSTEDYGVDAHIEVVEDEQATGKLIALQIKSGESFFKDNNENRYASFECRDLSQQFQNFMAASHNIVLPFSKNGMETWDKPRRDYLVQNAISDCHKEWLKLQFEYHKVHR